MPHVRWDKGGEAQVTTAEDDRVELASTIPSAPGSRLAGALESGTKLRVKVARCRRRGGALPENPPPVTYVIEGRLIDASRSARDEIAALAAAVSTSSSASVSTSTTKSEPPAG